jgi:hypothetical protein
MQDDTLAAQNINDHAQERTRRITRWVLFAAAAVFVYLLLFKFPATPFYFESDQMIALYDADRMLRGERLYADFFQFTFPGAQTLYFVLFTIFGAKFWLLPAATLAVLMLIFWFLLKASEETIPSPYCYLPPVLFMFFGVRIFGLDGSHRMFCSLFVLLAFYILLRSTTAARLVAAGCFCALASFFTQQRGVVMVGSLGIFVIVEAYVSGLNWKTTLKRLLLLGGSFAVCLFALCFYFIATAGFDLFINSTLVYPANYYGYHEENNFGIYFITFQRFLDIHTLGQAVAVLPVFFYGIVIPLVVPAAAIVFLVKRRSADWNTWRKPCIIFLVAAATLLSTTNPNSVRYFQMSAPFLILLGWLLAYFDVLRSRKYLLIATACVLLIGYSALQAFQAQRRGNYIRIEAPRGTVLAIDTEPIHRYLWLQQHTTPGDRVFEIYNPFVYFLLDLRNPTAYPQLHTTDYTRPQFVYAVIESLKKDPPKYILWDRSYSFPTEQRASGDHIGPLYEYLLQNYEPTGDAWHEGDPRYVREMWKKKAGE